MQIPPITLGFIVVCVAVFMLQQSQGDAIVEQYALWPWGEYFHTWQLVTYAFLHGGFQHLFFNMVGLVVFGSDLERLWGASRYIAFLLVSIVAAGLTQIGVNALVGSFAPTVGASGGIYGLLLAFAMIFPDRRLIALVFPVPLRARTFALVFAGIELFSGVTGTSAGVAHFAHLGGMVGGLLMLLLWKLEDSASLR